MSTIPQYKKQPKKKVKNQSRFTHQHEKQTEQKRSRIKIHYKGKILSLKKLEEKKNYYSNIILIPLDGLKVNINKNRMVQMRNSTRIRHLIFPILWGPPHIYGGFYIKTAEDCETASGILRLLEKKLFFCNCKKWIV